VGEHLVIKDYNNKILENDNHIHLDTLKKNYWGLAWGVIFA
jgi:hypothetical protein